MGILLNLTRAEEQFVRARDTCRIATITKEGWPHRVPVGYLYKKEDFYIPSSRRREAQRYCGLKKKLHAKYGKKLPVDAKNSYIKSVIAKDRAERKSRD